MQHDMALDKASHAAGSAACRPVLLSLLSVVHEAVKELIGVLIAELLALGLQRLDGLLMLLLPLAQILLGEFQEALAVDCPV